MLTSDWLKLLADACTSDFVILSTLGSPAFQASRVLVEARATEPVAHVHVVALAPSHPRAFDNLICRSWLTAFTSCELNLHFPA